MKTYTDISRFLAHERREQERADAAMSRMAASLPRAPRQPGQVRGVVGRSLIRMGQRLSESEASFEPARPR